MYLVIIVLPILGSIVSGFFGRKVGVSGARLITSLSVVLTTIIAVFAFLEVALNNICVSIWLFRWIDSESLNVLWGFNFDSLTVSMLIPVLIVSSLVHIYSIGYMSHDPHNQRFFSYLSLFTFMMIILVTANNFLLMFVGWEGVGVCSYLLVSFWFTRIAANQSSISAFLTNRVGDCFLTLGMFTILWTFGNLDYSTVFSLVPYINENAITIIGICLLIGAMAKSSQVGLHVWLPLAMEGPTPVSALIHAATMVTAGVYLLMRSSPLIEYSSTVLIICLWIGSITTVFSSLIGLFQQDIKKVIAYSTMSQLGMMVIAVGLSSYNIALFHLVNHAFYKGLLFLGAGAVIHAVADNQDFRKYGGLLTFLPLTYTVMFIASLSLVAFPFMTGFYSKDFILESAFAVFKYYSSAVYFIAIIGAMFTTLYSIKVLFLTFIINPNGPLVSYKNAHEGNIFMNIPLIILALFSVFFGYVTKDIFIGLGTGLFTDNSLFIHPIHEMMVNTEFGVSTLFKLLPLTSTLVLSVLFIYEVEFLPNSIIYFKSTRLGYNIFSFFSLRFMIEFVYNKFITRFVLKLGGQTTKILDKGSVELAGPYGLEKGLPMLSASLKKLDTGVVTSYALYILIGLILYMLIPYMFYNDTSLLMLIFYALYISNKSINNKQESSNKSNASISFTLQSSLFKLPSMVVKKNLTTNKGKEKAHTPDQEETGTAGEEDMAVPDQVVTGIFDQEETAVSEQEQEQISSKLYDAISRVADTEYPEDATEEEIENITTQREMDAIEVVDLKDKLPTSAVDKIMAAIPTETLERYTEFVEGPSNYMDDHGRILGEDGLPKRVVPLDHEETPSDHTDDGSKYKTAKDNMDDGKYDKGTPGENSSGFSGGTGESSKNTLTANNMDYVINVPKSIMFFFEPFLLRIQESGLYTIIAETNLFYFVSPGLVYIIPLLRISIMLTNPVCGPINLNILKLKYELSKIVITDKIKYIKNKILS